MKTSIVQAFRAIRTSRASMRTLVLGISLASAAGFIGCQSSNEETALNEPKLDDNVLTVPVDFPSVVTPANNPLTPAKFELGRRLFFDTRLSINKTQSCGSCHDPAAAFSDSGKVVSTGAQGQRGVRNAPGIWNIAYAKSLFWDGRAHTMEEQAIMPIANPIELNCDSATVIQRLIKEPLYNILFKNAFGDKTVTMERVGKAIATFERCLISGESQFDQFNRGNKGAIGDAAKRGFELFKDKLVNCIACHLGPNFTDEDYHSTGLERFYDDLGRQGITNSEKDNGKFKTPSLRNIVLTFPYMHNGKFNSLLDVLKHYNEGGQHSMQQDSLIKPLHLSDSQMQDIIAFLYTLTDAKFTLDPRFKNPWKS